MIQFLKFTFNTFSTFSTIYIIFLLSIYSIPDTQASVGVNISSAESSSAIRGQHAAETALSKPLDIPIEKIDINEQDIDEIDVMINSIKRITSNDPGSVIIIQMSGVLFMPIDKEFFVTDSNYRSIRQKALSATRQSKMDYIGELMLTKYKHKALDERIINFTSELIDKGIKVIILSPNVSGRFNDIAYLETWTADWLKERGIDLDKSVYRETKFVMNKYSTKRNGSYPTFYKGLLSCSTDKGYNVAHSIIASFFVTMNEKPRNVVMIYNDKGLKEITEQQLKSINSAVQFFSYDTQQKLKNIIPKDDASDIKPEGYLNFWKKFGKQLNAVIRNNLRNSDQGNPYEEDI